ncbi:MAG: hypothetical protein ACI857_002359, partial [Arenicella sp.]
MEDVGRLMPLIYSQTAVVFETRDWKLDSLNKYFPLWRGQGRIFIYHLE